MKQKGESGQYLCTNPPYGYKKDPDNPKRWIVDEEAAAVVKQIFAWCMEGYYRVYVATDEDASREEIVAEATKQIVEYQDNALTDDPDMDIEEDDILGVDIDYDGIMYDDSEEWYLYYTPHRPPAPGTIPKDGLLAVFTYKTRKAISEHCIMAWGHVEYNRPLTEKEISDYELFFGGKSQ